MILLTLNLFMSAMFIMLNHPLSMGLILIIQTFMISMITGKMNSNFWFSYIIFLIMVGGMLILFIYMTSIASNEKFKWSPSTLVIPMATTMLMLINFSMLLTKKTHDSAMMKQSQETMFYKLLNMPLSSIMFLLIIYLLITLIASVNITKINQGPLRQMN